MLLDDSLEIDEIPSSGLGAELVPMIKWHDVQFSTIWIPSELLLNRQCLSQTPSNVYQSVLCRTLEKHDVLDSLSIYSETEIQKGIFDSNEKLLDSLEELRPKYTSTGQTYLQKVNEGETYSCCELHPNCLNTTNSELALNCENNACLEEKCDSPANSIADYLEHLYISDDEDKCPLIEIINEPDKSRTDMNTLDYSNDKKVLESCNEISSNSLCDMPVEADTCPLNNEVVQDSVQVSFSSSNEIEHIFEVDEKLLNEHKLGELHILECPISVHDYLNEAKVMKSCGDETSTKSICDMPVKTSPSSTKVVLNSPTASFSSFDQIEDIFEVSEKLWNDRLNNEISDLKSETCDTVESIITGQSSELSQSDLNNKENGFVENIEVKDFPFMLQKSKGEDLSTVASHGKNNKKEKRLKKKAPKIIPLDNFFLSKKEAAASDTEYLAFYESLCKKQSCRDTFEKSEFTPISSYSAEFNAIKESKCLENSNCVTDSTTSFSCNVHSTSVEENLTRYVIENIPHFVEENTLLTFIAEFGDIIIKSLVMEQSGKTLKAILEVSLEDPNWLIECLNESQPFGASDEYLKCYQIL